MRQIPTSVWVVLITDGTVTVYPPEVYSTERQATNEAERWAWLLADGLQDAIDRPFQGRWEVGGRNIRLVHVTSSATSPWIGTFWSTDGSPDPEAVVLEGRNEARDWVTAPLAGGQVPVAVDERGWTIAATFLERGEESYAVASRAKVVSPPPSEEIREIEYEVEIVGTFLHSIRSLIKGPAGLSRRQIEDLIEQEWANLSMDTQVLLESSWELVSFRRAGS